MKRITFVNCPSPFLASDRGAPPLGILWLAAECRSAGYDVRVVDLTGDTQLAEQFGCDAETFVARGAFWYGDLMDGLRPERDIVALSSTSAQYHEASNLLTALKWECSPTLPVIIGGSHASALPAAAMADGFDAVFAGEADTALVDWLNGGAGFRGIIHCQAPRDLDVLPLPARDLVDLQSYCSNLTVGEGFSTTVLMSRGCSFACRYCVRTLGDAARIVRVRDLWSIAAELETLDDRYGLRRFVAVDDLWGVKRRWVEDFCDLFAGTPYRFRVNMRANVLHPDLLPSMKAAGIDCISFGFESGSEQVLSAISKNNLELNTKAVHACHDAGIAVKAYLIFGFAEDDAASVEATMRWIEQVKPASAQCAWLVPLPGTPIYQQAITQGWREDYSTLYHNGRDRRGGMSRLPWHTDETAELYEDLCAWLEGFYAERQPVVECPNALSSMKEP